MANTASKAAATARRLLREVAKIEPRSMAEGRELRVIRDGAEVAARQLAVIVADRERANGAAR